MNNILEIMSEKMGERIIRRKNEGLEDLVNNNIMFHTYETKEDLLDTFKNVYSNVYSFEKSVPIAAKEGSDKEFFELITKQVFKTFTKDFENIADFLDLKDKDFKFKIFYFSEINPYFKNEEYLKVNVHAVASLRILGYSDIILDLDYINLINLILNKQIFKIKI